MANLISSADKNRLYTDVKVCMGYPVRQYTELQDAVLDSLFRMSLEEYTAMINSWLIEQQWGSLQGSEIDSANFVYALTTKTLDWEHSFTYAYSKQLGIGGDGPWELKKDYVEVQANTQVYSIPAGREINEVLWNTPPVIGHGSLGASDWVAGPNGWQFNGLDASAMLPAFGILLSAQDRAQKRRILMSEMSYRVTAGPNKTKLLHLYPMPGSQDEMPSGGSRHHVGSRVWYFYYDTNTLGRKKCLEMNDDIIKLPDDVPLQKMHWDKINVIAQTRIRKILTAKANTFIGKIRGTFKGEMSGLNDSPITMDYEMFLTEGKELMTTVTEEVMKSLEKISNATLMAERADIAENLNRILSKQAVITQFMMG